MMNFGYLFLLCFMVSAGKNARTSNSGAASRIEGECGRLAMHRAAHAAWRRAKPWRSSLAGDS
ncbi:hypothetical protein [Paenibacillus apiarius]|uniref:hypothetical protein n=1 Tax=Paenibacillus apiarius TaxID=46240 RepID=UPI003B3B7FF5